ncbi:hypothetical protein VKT23_000136 [Stygiomarasmius scandens]|uniref:Protein-S-isoprenylcysteine O-methyltransferase n=1 Tax=Marasmiellus scandens TaxID=2682957 RepID=A0ABR1K550_9AGAR
MSLSKAALLLVACVFVMVSLTSPNPPARKDDQVEAQKTQKGITTRGAYISQSLPLITFILESLAIFAYYSPTNPVATLLLNLTSVKDTTILQRPSALFYFGLFFLGLSAYIRSRCYQELGKHFTFEVTLLDNHKLITTGPYSVVRHPSYTACYTLTAGFVSVWISEASWLWGSGFWSRAWGQIIFAAWVFWWSRVLIALTARVWKEDQLLKKQFGKEWVEWEKKVPWKIFPGLF